MRARILILCVVFARTLGFCQGSLYVFSGHVSDLYYDGGGVLAAQHFAVGDPVSAQFQVDFDRPGYYLLNDGTIEKAEWPPLSSEIFQYFYSRFVSGTLLPELNGGFNNGATDIREFFVGWDHTGLLGGGGVVQGGSGDSYITIQEWSPRGGIHVQDWAVGTVVRGYMVAYSDKDASIAWADMTLVSISPIPEPNVMSLILAAGLVFTTLRRARANKSLE